ncbi:MAG: hypothetical protein QXS81_05315 [Candidatus Micrarchaeaceae archaeon]
MKSIDILQYLQRNGITVFTTGDLSKIIGKPISYTRNVVRRLPGVMKAERGIYYTEQASIYEIASNIVHFSYVSMISALRYYDIVTQMPRVVYVVSPKRHRNIMIMDYKIKFVKFKKSAVFGYVRRGNAFIAEPEKAILDSLYHNDFAYVDEALEKGISDKLIEIDKMISYAYSFGKKALITKLGFFLDFYCNISVDKLLERKSGKPVYLAKGARKYNRKWGVYYG